MFARELTIPRIPLWLGVYGALGGLLWVYAASQLGPKWSLLMMCGLVLACLVMLSPKLGLLLTVAVIPMERIGRLTGDSSMYTVSLMRVMGLLALGSFLLHAFLKKHKVQLGTAFFLYSVYCGLALLTITYTNDLLGAVRASGAILGNLLFFFLVINVVRSWSLAKTAVLVWLAASVLVGGYTIYDWYWGQSVEVEEIGVTEARFSTVMQDTSEWKALDVVKRAVGPTSSAAVYGINMILTVPFFVYFLRTRLSWQARILVFLALFVVIYNILLTNTRAAILLLGVVFVLCIVRRLAVIKLREVVVILLLCVCAVVAAPSAIYTRVLDPAQYTYQQSDTLRIRLQYWQVGFEIARDNWLMGIGVGNQNTIPGYLNTDGPESTSVHNEFLQTFLDVGVVGWLVFFGFVVLVLWAGFKAGSALRPWRQHEERYWFLLACQIAMIAVLIYGWQVDVFHFPLKGWWLVAGLSWVMYRFTRLERAQISETLPLGAHGR
jgi:hypothetical protein